jgi:hypothetical protein
MPVVMFPTGRKIHVREDRGDMEEGFDEEGDMGAHMEMGGMVADHVSNKRRRVRADDSLLMDDEHGVCVCLDVLCVCVCVCVCVCASVTPGLPPHICLGHRVPNVRAVSPHHQPHPTTCRQPACEQPLRGVRQQSLLGRHQRGEHKPPHSNQIAFLLWRLQAHVSIHASDLPVVVLCQCPSPLTPRLPPFQLLTVCVCVCGWVCVCMCVYRTC